MKHGTYVERYAAIVGLLKKAPKMTLDDLAAITELHPGSCRRFLAALTDAGVLTQSQEKAIRQQRNVWRWNP